ncbi:PAS domain-containing protein [Paracoccus aurantiacus]|uniref:PAS domain-containing protein n=1 Tax=Paracoccus aurantiacus TaxID=2599412 RepID=A0A5C6S0C4_9RHOB|nr:PAS-domain containing protein [Paracoccus aurantiacus]TXB67813.1 PAS domain-containing protein [Paracoccus aurantiacus]
MHVFLTVAIAVAGSALSFILAILAMRWTARPERRALLDADLVAPCIFLFNGARLVDATGPARAILAGCAAEDLPALKIWLAQRFDDLSVLDDLSAHHGRVELLGRGGTGTARLRLLAEETEGGSLRLTLVQPDCASAGIVVDSLSQQAMEEELALLRQIVEAAPMMITRRDDAGNIVWANATYLNAVEKGDKNATPWPLPEILKSDATPDAAAVIRRARVEGGEGTNWFDCYEHSDGDGTTTYALPADAEVRAEQNLREFLQTLTKTFADLPIGLAIFDRERQLQLFNPALIDLTGLSVGFLTARPSLYSVLDQLRELRIVPEPRDYRSWRKQITTLEAAAAAGHHVETWSLPGGRTYRVTGRPHPGGAIAFLFDDITSEITLTRKFRAELSLGSQVLDGLERALIVFNAVGQVVMVNRAYTQLWGENPGRMSDALKIWRGDWAEAPGLAELERELSRDGVGGQDRGVIFGPAGTGVLAWSMTALPGGKRMVRFAAASASQADTAQPPVEALAGPGRQAQSLKA